MKRKHEDQLVKLLKRLYGRDWQFTWKGTDNGFSLRLEVEKQVERQSR